MRNKKALLGKSVVLTAEFLQGDSDWQVEHRRNITEATARLVPAIIDSGATLNVIGFTNCTPLIINLCRLNAASALSANFRKVDFQNTPLLHIWEAEENKEEIQNIRNNIKALPYVKLTVIPSRVTNNEAVTAKARLLRWWDMVPAELRKSDIAQIVVGCEPDSFGVLIPDVLSSAKSSLYPLQDTGGLARELGLGRLPYAVNVFENEIKEDLNLFYNNVAQQIGARPCALALTLQQAEQAQGVPFSELAARIVEHFSKN